jgi:hypothetical protein
MSSRADAIGGEVFQALPGPTDLFVDGNNQAPTPDVTLTWTDNSVGEIGFNIFRSEDEVNWQFVVQTDANVTTYFDDLPDDAPPQYYYVNAQGAHTVSLPSAVELPDNATVRVVDAYSVGDDEVEYVFDTMMAEQGEGAQLPLQFQPLSNEQWLGVSSWGGAGMVAQVHHGSPQAYTVPGGYWRVFGPQRATYFNNLNSWKRLAPGQSGAVRPFEGLSRQGSSRDSETEEFAFTKDASDCARFLVECQQGVFCQTGGETCIGNDRSPSQP